MLYYGGMMYILLSALSYAPGSLLFIRARREQGGQVFTGAERNIFIVLALAAVFALYAIFAGMITI